MKMMRRIYALQSNTCEDNSGVQLDRAIAEIDAVHGLDEVLVELASSEKEQNATEKKMMNRTGTNTSVAV